MDKLELLKKDWQKKKVHFKQLTKDEIYPMLWKRSTSIVKWLFYISVAELTFWFLMNFLPIIMSSAYKKKFAHLENDILSNIHTYISLGGILIFAILLYRAHKSISVIDNAKTLMKSIIKTRTIIKYFVLFNLVMLFLAIVFSFYIILHYDPNIRTLFEQSNLNQKTMTILVVMIVFTAVFLTLFWFIYKLIYGRLIKKLSKNYGELKKLDS